MPRVSVLIPAYKPAYLSQAIASVLAQTYDDFELLISDDSPESAAAPIIARFDDRRIRRLEGPRQGLVANTAFLWTQAGGEYVKYVYDDDLLMPGAVARLVSALDSAPPASFAFVMRHLIDAEGAIWNSPRSLPGDRMVGFRAEVVVNAMLPSLENFIGEPTCTLFRRGLLGDDRFIREYQGFPIRHLVDVAMYLNALDTGPCLGVPEFHAAFRVHPEQASAQTRAAFAPGIMEWELFLRGELVKGRLRRENGMKAVAALERAYTHHGRRPEMQGRLHGLQDLRCGLLDGTGRVFDDAFRAAWERAHRPVL